MLRLTTVIMASVKSDKVKQSLDDLEKYRLFTEGNLKPFIHSSVVPYSARSCWKEKCVIYSHNFH